MNAGLPTFIAHATHPSLGEEVADGRIAIDQRNFRFESPEVVVEIPLERLEIETGEADEILLTDPELPDWVVYTLDERILNDQRLLRNPHTRFQIKELRSQGEFGKRMKITAWCIGGFIGITILGYLAMGLLVRALVARVPASYEIQQGNDAMAELQQQQTFIQDSNFVAKLERAVKPLTDALPQTAIPYKFYLVDDPDPNAFALPGGHVVVTKGLMELAERPEQIAGAVAHEIAHVNLKHHLREEISGLGPYLIFQLFMHGEGRLLGVIGAGSQLLIKQSFSQEYELEADSTGWDYLVKAHIDPRGSIELLKKFKAEEDRYKDFDVIPQAFSSHPGTEKRIKILERRWNRLKPKDGFIDLGPWDQTGGKPSL